MFYSAAHSSIVYQLNPSAAVPVLATIPEARQLPNNLISIPFELRNMQIMRHLGHQAMSPMTLPEKYGWPSRFPCPRPNQLVTAAFKTLHPRNMDTSEMRCGKTLASLWAADYLMNKGIIHKALILSPLSTLKRVWDHEIFSNFLGQRTCSILYGDRAKRMKALEKDADFYVLNHDGLGIGCKRVGHSIQLGPLAKELIRRTDIDLIIMDEASIYKHAGTMRWKIANHLLQSKPDAWRWGLTGTPAAGAPTDAWAIGRLIYGKEGRPESFETFRQRTMFRVSDFKWAAKPGAEKVVANWLQPAIRYTRKELGFPPLSYETREVELSPKQAEAYKTMRKDLEIWTHDQRRIDAVNEAVLRNKLIQISCGAVYGPEHKVYNMDAAPRLQALDDIIEEAGGKFLVFAGLTGVLDMIHSHLHKSIGSAIVNGNVGAGARNRIFEKFCDPGNDLRVLVADPRTMAHGLNLTAASTIIWFGPIDSLELYEQANARIDGPEACGVVIHLASTPVEREIYRRLQEKQALQGSILELLKAG